MKNNITDIIKIIITIVCSFLLLACAFVIYKEYKDLNDNPYYIKAIIIETENAKRGMFIKYSFTVGEKVYVARRRISNNDNAQIGDSCEIKYEKGDPQNSSVIKIKKTVK